MTEEELVITIDDINKLFEIGKIVGKGAYGLVKQVIAISTIKIKNGIKEIIINKGKSYAAKIIKSTEKKEYIKTLFREYTILQRLDHENIIKVYALYFSKNDNNYYLIMELLEQTLLSYLKKNDIELDEKIDIMIGILNGVQYLHTKPFPNLENRFIVHFDLKEDNIMIEICDNKISKLKIIDFGISRIMNEGIYLSERRSGTIPYMAPELLCLILKKEEREACGPEYINEFYGKLVDMWSCGVIFFTMLLKNLPFGENPVTVFVNVFKYAKDPMNYIFGKTADGEAITLPYIELKFDFLIGELMQKLLEPKAYDEDDEDEIRWNAYNAIKHCQTIKESMNVIIIDKKLTMYNNNNNGNIYGQLLLEKERRIDAQRKYDRNELKRFGDDFGGEHNEHKLLYEDARKCRIVQEIHDKIYFYCSHILDKKTLFQHLVQNAVSMQQKKQYPLCYLCPNQ